MRTTLQRLDCSVTLQIQHNLNVQREDGSDSNAGTVGGRPYSKTDALRNVLAKHFDISGVARNGAQMVQKTMTEFPDVVIADVTMPVVCGIEAARILHREVPGSKLLLLTMHDDLFLVREAFLAGVLGFVHKSCSASFGSEQTMLRSARM